ncbi:MAG: hypothetical protein CVT80_04545 [Alphaproteobacteria bacterium HGW-Alphaproteobacteria-2]|nr:MAG: hypothetical protein CVT80_04545 [Alphaproteobacteria bacterium HGW-Alphaproteobacteria-2]
MKVASTLLTPLLLALSQALAALPLHAQMLTPEDAVVAELLPGWRLADGRHMTALRLRLAPGWKTYWRAPGEGGIAPRLTWEGSENLAQVIEHWPRPDIYRIAGLQSLGYEHELVLPLEIVPQDKGRPVALRATADIGVCERICMPVSLQLAAALDADGPRDMRILAALDRAPVSSAAASVEVISCRLAPIADGLRVTAEFAVPGEATMATEAAVFELPGSDLWIGTAELRRAPGRLVAEADILGGAGALALDRSQMRITLIAADSAVEISGCRSR